MLATLCDDAVGGDWQRAARWPPNVCRRFTVLCRELKLFSQAIVATDSSKFKAVNNRDRNFTAVKIDRFQEQFAQSIQRYLDTLETADRTQPVGLEAKTERLQVKVKKLRQRMRALDEIKMKLKGEADEQLSLTDPDSRSMATSRLGSGFVGYNVQVAVDAKHHLIVAHEVTSDSSDRSQLSAMALAARTAMGKTKLHAHADRGYYNCRELKVCEDAGIAAYVPKSSTSNAKAEGRFDKADFIYIARDDEFRCPAGQRAIYRFTGEELGMSIRRYWSSACPNCPIKAQCTTSDYRRISRWEHEAVLDRVQLGLDLRPAAMAVRKRTVEHVFGTLKHRMGSAHFQTRRLPHVATEMSLHVLAYNLKRVMSILGTTKTMKAMTLMGA